MGERSSVVHEDVALKIREAFYQKHSPFRFNCTPCTDYGINSGFLFIYFCINCKLVFSLPNHSVKLIYEGQGKQQNHRLFQGYKARKVNCSCVYSAYILKPWFSLGEICKQE